MDLDLTGMDGGCRRGYDVPFMLHTVRRSAQMRFVLCFTIIIFCACLLLRVEGGVGNDVMRTINKVTSKKMHERS